MTLVLPPEMEEKLLAVVREEMGRRLMDHDEARLLRTATAAALLEMSETTFRQTMAALKIDPVRLGPRVTRWRMTDLKGIGQKNPR